MKNFPVGKVGVGVTAIYFIGLGIAMHRYGLTQFTSYNELGDFLAGAFSPVAFLWLVLGFFQQQKELQQNTDALKLQAQELQNSVEQYKEMVAVAQKQLDSELTKAQREDAIRENETRPSIKFSHFGWNSKSGAEFVYATEVEVGPREAKNLVIEFSPVFGEYSVIKRDFVKGNFGLGRNYLRLEDFPQEVTVTFSYESMIGIKYKHQYRYSELDEGSYGNEHHEEIKL
ncbi:hypothetical protein NB694_000325 [Pantoea ananatis]|uniref:hypothetical protein n=1 Tax=Pantoea ananas TaxID=553 RepID=UPI0021F7729D|nr:hypothetical protein [Pantoea ananatis]MCW0310525.1 hypothetical protein [Pantoea ananatis]